MTGQTPPPPAHSAFTPSAPSTAAIGGGPLQSKLWRAIVCVVKILWGAFFCKSIAGALLVIGWAQRAAQRAALKHWWQRSPAAQQPFETFLRSEEELSGHLHWPNWFLRQSFRPRESRSAWDFLRALATSLRANFWLGVQGVFCTAVLLLPSGLLWWFGWDYGWNISYYKSYEQFAIGTGMAAIGIVLFVVAMFYVPMAQARQAVTGQWRTFFQFHLVWRIVQQQWVRCIGLAMLCGLCAVPINALKVAPMYLAGRGAEPEFASEAAAYAYLNSYYFWMALVGFPLFVLLRLVSARIYAAGILALVRENKVGLDELAPIERTALERLQMLRGAPSVQRHWLARLMLWALTRAGRFFTGGFLVLVWLGCVAQMYISEFLHYHEWGRGWINQPLLQLPLFNYMPIASGEPGKDLGQATFILLTALLGSKLIGLYQRAKSHAAPAES